MTDKNKDDKFPKYILPIFIIGFILYWIIEPIHFFVAASKQEIGETLAASLLGCIILALVWYKVK